MSLRWGCGGSLASLALFLCLCLAVLQLPGCASLIRTAESDSEEPPPATCENAGEVYADNPFSGWPLAGRGWGDVNYSYCDPTYYEVFGRDHYGMDLDAYHRESVYATAHATVTRAAYDTVYGMGKHVKLCTDSGWCAIFMHLDEWVVTVGQSVSPGTLLGYADNTGFSTGTHLHYEIRHPEGFAVDPAPTLDAFSAVSSRHLTGGR